MKMINVIGNG